MTGNPPGTEDAEARFARLLAVVRHELLTPLSVIDGFADLLAAEFDRREIDAIRRNAKLAMLLLDRLRDADDIIEGTELALEREEVDVVELVRDTLDDLEGTLLVDHELRFEPPDEPMAVNADPSRIRQVLFNLLSNAAKYSSPETTIVVALRATGDVVEIAVTNEGEGIAPADVEKAFQAFSRLSDEEPGTGLGLAIARAIARAHGGDLVARPAPDGPGARFVMELPRS